MVEFLLIMSFHFLIMLVLCDFETKIETLDPDVKNIVVK